MCSGRVIRSYITSGARHVAHVSKYKPGVKCSSVVHIRLKADGIVLRQLEHILRHL